MCMWVRASVCMHVCVCVCVCVCAHVSVYVCKLYYAILSTAFVYNLRFMFVKDILAAIAKHCLRTTCRQPAVCVLLLP